MREKKKQGGDKTGCEKDEKKDTSLFDFFSVYVCSAQSRRKKHGIYACSAQSTRNKQRKKERAKKQKRKVTG